jgi:hypothetical protein
MSCSGEHNNDIISNVFWHFGSAEKNTKFPIIDLIASIISYLSHYPISPLDLDGTIFFWSYSCSSSPQVKML